MSTTEQKIKKIEDIILQKAGAKADSIISKAMAQKKDLLEEKEMEFLQKKYKEINTATLDIRRKTTQYISSFEIKNKKRLLLKRDDFCNRIFENVFIKLCNFTTQEKYVDMFREKLKNINYQDLSVINFYIKKGDKALSDVIISRFGADVSIIEDSDIKIGGFRSVNKFTGLCLDETFDNKLSEQKSWFYSNSKLFSF